MQTWPPARATLAAEAAISGIDVLVLVKPCRAPDLGVEDLVRDEPADLGVVVDRRRREEVGLAERPAVGDQQRRRVRDPGPREQLDHVGEERDDGQAVLVAAEAVERVRQVQLQVQARPRWSA